MAVPPALPPPHARPSGDRATGRPVEKRQQRGQAKEPSQSDPDQRRRAGAAALSEAYSVASRLGAEPLRREIESLARRARLLSSVIPALSRTPDQAGHHSVTTREREVLELICAGATNRRVASQLFISEKTVSIHVSRILAKLDATNRGEAAAIAHRIGLVWPGH